MSMETILNLRFIQYSFYSKIILIWQLYLLNTTYLKLHQGSIMLHYTINY